MAAPSNPTADSRQNLALSANRSAQTVRGCIQSLGGGNRSTRGKPPRSFLRFSIKKCTITMPAKYKLYRNHILYSFSFYHFKFQAPLKYKWSKCHLTLLT